MMRARKQGTKRKDGRWQLVLTLTAENGGKHRKTFIAHSQKAVQALAEDFLKGNAERRPRPSMRLDRFLALWTERREHGWSAATQRSYEQARRLYIVPAIGAMQIRDLKPIHVEQMTARLEAGGKQRSASLARDVLRTALRYALKLGLVESNAAELADPPRRVRKDRDMITVGEWESVVLEELDPVWRAMWRTLGEAGLRPSEARLLTWNEIRREEDGYWIVLETAKTDEGRKPVPIGGDLHAELLSVRRHDSLLVFPNERGQPYHQRTLIARWKKALEWAGVGYTNLYQLRKLFGREAAKRVPDHILKRLMRHTDIRTTKVYYVEAEREQLRASVCQKVWQPHGANKEKA